ncbi:MAG: histidine kinase, partial [Ruthenibacterium sp.]
MVQSRIPRYVGILRKIKISQRIFLMFLLLSFIPVVVIGSTAYFMTAHHIDSKVKEYCVQMNLGFRAAFDEVFSGMAQTSIGIIYDVDVQRKINEVLRQPSESMASYTAQNELKSELIKRIVLNETVTRANVSFQFAEPCLYSRYEMGNYSRLAAVEAETTAAAEQKDGGLVWHSLCELYYGTEQTLPYLQRQYPILQTAREFSLISEGVPVGTITLWFNETELDDLCRKMDVTGSFYILDPQGNVVFSNQKSEMHLPFLHWDAVRTAAEAGTHVWKLSGEDTIITLSKSAENDYYYAHMQPYSVLVTDNNRFAVIMALLCVFSLMMASIASTMYAKSIHYPLESIRDTLHTMVQSASFDTEIGDSGADEIAQLSHEIDIIIGQLGTLIEENYAIKLKEHKFRLMALKAQINPHFLFNTIDGIRWIARENEDFEVSKRLEMLSTILRNVMRDDQMLVTFEQEISNTKNYLALQQTSLKNRMAVCWSVDKSVLQCKTLLLMLQPLVENAIFHGMKPDAVLHLDITIKDCDSTVFVCVADDGNGM